MEFLGKSPVAPMFGITSRSWFSDPKVQTDMVAEIRRREIAPTFLSSVGQAHNTLFFDPRGLESESGFMDLSNEQH